MSSNRPNNTLFVSRQQDSLPDKNETNTSRARIPLVGGDLTQGKLTRQQLETLSNTFANVRAKTAVFTPLCRLVEQKMRAKESVIIVANEGCGKSSAVDYVDNIYSKDEYLDAEDNPLWICYKSISDADQLWNRLWNEFIPMPDDCVNFMLKHITQSYDSISCTFCNRNCDLVRRKSKSFFSIAVEVESMHFLDALLKISGKCPLKKMLVTSRLNDIMNMVLELPKAPDSDLLASVKMFVNEKRNLILLIPFEAEKKVTEVLPNIRKIVAPLPSSQDIRAIVNQKFKDSMLQVSPFPDGSFSLLAAMSNLNPGRFIDLLYTLVNQLIDDGLPQIISLAGLVEKLRLEIDLKLALKLSLLSLIQKRGGSRPVSVSNDEILDCLRAIGFSTLNYANINPLMDELGFNIESGKKRRVAKGVRYFLDQAVFEDLFYELSDQAMVGKLLPLGGGQNVAYVEQQTRNSEPTLLS